jgi:hypothetical protein
MRDRRLRNLTSTVNFIDYDGNYPSRDVEASELLACSSPLGKRGRLWMRGTACGRQALPLAVFLQSA